MLDHNSQKQKIEFFTEEDFALLKKWAGRNYNSENDTHKNVKEALKKGSWAKTRYWCQQVAKIVGFEVNTSLTWHKQAGPGKLEFRPYTWGRMFDPEAFTKEIYFTVGMQVKESNFLLAKIDRHHQNPKQLSEEQLQKATEGILNGKNNYVYSQKISLNELENYNWEKLINLSVQFVETYKENYSDILQNVKELSNLKFTRVCWNTNGWTEPSGIEGKSNSPNSFEYLNGFGFEEWLFSEELNSDGYQYGFIQGVNQDNPQEEFMNLDLFAIQNTRTSSVPHWVASIEDVKLFKPEEAKQIEEDLELASFFKEKIKNLTGDIDLENNIQSYLNGNYINVRFKLSDVEFPMDENRTEVDLDTSRFSRYKLYNGTLWDQLKTDLNTNKKEEYGLGEISFKRSSKTKSTAQRSAGSYEMHRKHDEISRGLEKYLRSIKNDGEKVTPECGQRDGRAIDMVHVKGEDAVLYEIKTYPSIRRTIREGLGQLLEYAYWDNPYDEYNLTLTIVGMESPNKITEEYMQFLRSNYGLPIYYQHYISDRNELRRPV